MFAGLENSGVNMVEGIFLMPCRRTTRGFRRGDGSRQDMLGQRGTDPD